MTNAQKQPRTITLPTMPTIAAPSRKVSAVVAAAGLFLGAVAVFFTDNQIGALGLLAIGAFAGRAWLNHSSEASDEVIVDMLSRQLAPEQLQETAARLRLEGVSPLGDAMTASARFGLDAHEQLRESSTEMEWSYQPRSTQSRSAGKKGKRVGAAPLVHSDAVVDTGEGRIAVEIKSSGERAVVLAAVRRLQALTDVAGAEAGLIAIDGPVPDDVTELLAATSAPMIAVDVSEGRGRLVEALKSLDQRLKGPDQQLAAAS